jgi:trimethylamine--corrinoid protein Co-methyltransferase
LPDAQAAYETANTLQAALLGGVNFMLHACGWLEGGLVSSLEKFVLDADQLGVLHSLAEGIDLSENGQAMGALAEVGPGGHFLGCQHTQDNFKSAFWRTQVLDYRPFETWAEAGGPDSVQLANTRVRRMLAEYEAPPIDPGVAEALQAFVDQRNASEPDAFG